MQSGHRALAASGPTRTGFLPGYRCTRQRGEFGKAAVESSWCADLAQKLHKHKAASREQYMHLTCVHVYMGKDMSDYILVMCL